MSDESAVNRSPLLPDRYPQGDFFVCDIFDAVPKADMASMEHPLFSLEAVAAQAEIPALNARPGARVHFAGAWQRYGFHEDGFWSAHRLCSQLLGRDAWAA